MKHLIFEAKQFLFFLVRFIFYAIAGGNSCILCGKKTYYIPVCRECDSSFFSVDALLKEERCQVCGKQLISTQEKCMKCRTEAVLIHTDLVYPLFSYRLWNKSLMFDWKIKGERSLSEFFAKKISIIINNLSPQVIVPVPPRKGKIRQKGWDQIEEICQFLEGRYGFKVLRILKRLTIFEQKKLNRSERLEHIKNAYSIVSPAKIQRALKPFSGKMPQEVCLIDDVCTTGATIESCSSVLKAAGVNKVLAVTLFTVD